MNINQIGILVGIIITIAGLASVNLIVGVIGIGVALVSAILARSNAPVVEVVPPQVEPEVAPVKKTRAKKTPAAKPVTAKTPSTKTPAKKTTKKVK